MSAVSSYGIREDGKRSDTARLKWVDASAALTMKGAEVAAEIRNLVRGVELWRRGADEQCQGMEGEVATCSALDERHKGGLVAERHDGGRSAAFNRSAGEWGGGVRLGAWPSGGGGGGGSSQRGALTNDGPSRQQCEAGTCGRWCHAALSRGAATLMSRP
jgi:hypothetical protein